MLANANDDVQISRWSAIGSGVSLPCQTNALAVAGSRLDANFQRLGPAYNSLAQRDRTALPLFSCSSALRAGAVELHAAGRLGTLSAAATTWTRTRFADKSLAATVRAGLLAGDIQAHHRAADGVPETDVNLVLKVGARFRLPLHGSAAPAAEHTGKNVSKAASLPSASEIGKIKPAEIERHFLGLRAATSKWSGAKSTGAEASASRVCLRCSRINVVRVKTELVVDFALLGVAQYVVGLRNFLELFFCLLITRIYIGMVFSRQFAESLANVLLRGALLHPQSTV